MGANAGKPTHGVFTKRPGTLTIDFFVNLLDMSTQWQPSDGSEGVYEGRDRKTNEVKWTGTRADKAGDEVEICVEGAREFALRRKPTRDELLKRLRAMRGRLPGDFVFDRNEAHER